MACMGEEGPDSILDFISENLREDFEQLAPEKNVRPKEKRPPWIRYEGATMN